MNEIKCPKCGTIFKLSESDYQSITKQVRDKEFEKEIKLRDTQHEIDKESAIRLVKINSEKDLQDKLYKKDMEITNLKNELKNMNSEFEIKVKTAISEKDNKIDSLTNMLEQSKKEYQIKEEIFKSNSEKELQEKIHKKEIEINNLKSELKLKETEKDLAIKTAINEKEKTINNISRELELSKSESLLKEKTLKESYEEKLKDRDEQILYYKDFKARQSTKMIGESLEVHCNNEFNKLRPLFKNSYFEKDNDIKTGSKGDFIFRDFDDDGTEIVSIMFEMKNEADKTATKHKNEDFLKELDKDRREKECEYAVLVSLLEIDNDYYNEGIVDMSYRYDKLYVIRPQFFIPLITLIRGMALNSLEYKRELKIVQNQNIDISNFEENMNNFKSAFGRNYKIASDKFKKAIEEIDKTIDHLQKTKDALISSDNNLRLANNKAEDLTIKKLTKNNKTLSTMFENLEKENH